METVGGVFEMGDVPPRGHSLTAVRVDGSQRASAGVNVVANETANVTLRFAALGRVKVKVLDVSGAPITGLQVVRLVGSPCAGEVRVTGGAESVAVFEDVPVPGAGFKAIQQGDVVEGFGTLRGDGDETLLTLQFGGFGTVAGKVLEADGFAHGAIVTLGARRFEPTLCAFVFDGRARQVRADTKGEFGIDRVPVGTFTVSARSAITEAEASAKDVLVSHGERKEFEFRLQPNVAGKLSGRVLLPSGEVVAGAGIAVTASSGGRPDVTVVTQGDGHYEFAKVFPPGTYTLTAEGDVVFTRESASVEDVFDLLERVAVGADLVERTLLEGQDANLEMFRDDLQMEVERA